MEDNNWGLFEIVPCEGKKPQKVPVDLNGNKKKGGAPALFVNSLEDVKASELYGRDGYQVGYHPAEGSEFVALDFDKCLDSEGEFVEGHPVSTLLPEGVPEAETASGVGLRVMLRRNGLDPFRGETESGVGYFGKAGVGITVPYSLLDGLSEAEEHTDVQKGVIAYIEGEKGSVRSSGGPTAKQANQMWQDSELSQMGENQLISTVADMLEAIPAEDDRDNWFDITCACHDLAHRVSSAETAVAIQGLWDDWSRKSANYCEKGNYTLGWDSLKFGKDGNIAFNKLVAKAKRQDKRFADFEPKVKARVLKGALEAAITASKGEPEAFQIDEPPTVAEMAQAVADARGAHKQTIDTKGWTTADLLASSVTRTPPLIENLVAPHLTYLVGDPKAGKSFLAMQVAEAISTGEPLLGNRTNGKRKVLYYAVENGVEETVARIKDMDLQGDTQWRFNGIHIDDSPESVEEMIAVMSDECLADPTIGCIILDTLRFMAGPPPKVEGTAQDRDFATLKPIQQWSSVSGVAVIAIAHTNKAQDGRTGMRAQLSSVAGSNLIAGTAESILTISRQVDPDTQGPSEFGVIQRMGRSMRNSNNIDVTFDGDQVRFIPITDRQRDLQTAVIATRGRGGCKPDILRLLMEEGRMRKLDVSQKIRSRRGVSRPTVKQAFDDLVDEGKLIEDAVEADGETIVYLSVR